MTAPADCEGCYRHKYLSFSWQIALRSNYISSRPDYPWTLERSHEAKGVTFYRCRFCPSLWYLTAQGMMNQIPAPLIHLAERWEKEDLRPQDAHLDFVRRIRAEDRQEGMLTVPCSATLKSGEVLDLCLLSFEPTPPSWSPSLRAFLLSDVAKFEPSVYAFPAEVRAAIARAPEMQVGYSPCVVEHTSGKRFTVNRPFGFFNVEGLRGDEFRVPHNRFSFLLAAPYIDPAPAKAITVVFGDWSDELADLLPEY